ncbi:Prostaglandin reductase 1 [Eumeta japonica]|uniref:Prostaglandin reductase 1 n=1 Tax=Eumeta variegata TaxID=151549 RepID=A0A4C1X6H7_EUMVA|nr:Prostaglandin reductase 1 [Eumeta japonica]
MVISKKYIVVAPFGGEPKTSDFQIVEEDLPSLKDNEFLAQAAYFSVDPYQRVKLGNQFPCDMIGGQIAKVIESKNPNYPVGAWVMGHFGWRTYTNVNPAVSERSPQKPYLYVLPDFGNLPVSLGIGVCGRVGNTAYFGLTRICQPKPGETVVVSGAAGAVGSHVGQIAKILGCKVIGIAGTDEKCKWLENELCFDSTYNYKNGNLADFLKEKAPNGVDCYFDNVGGELSNIVLSQMNEYGRIAVCGAISAYNAQNPLKAIIVQPMIVSKQLRMEGFQVNRYANQTMEGIKQNLQWVEEGKLIYREHIWDGFESAPNAFIGEKWHNKKKLIDEEKIKLKKKEYEKKRNIETIDLQNDGTAVVSDSPYIATTGDYVLVKWGNEKYPGQVLSIFEDGQL